MSLEIWIALAAANYLSAVAPGQNVALVSTATSRHGIRGGTIVVTGTLIADCLWCLLALGLALGASQISSSVLLGVQVVSGFVLLLLGFNIIRTSKKSFCANDGRTPIKRTKLFGQGLCVSFANPLTIVFFLALFPAFLPANLDGLSADRVMFYVTAIAVSGFVALLPYVLASLALTKAGLGKVLSVFSGSSLILLGGAAVAQAVI